MPSSPWYRRSLPTLRPGLACNRPQGDDGPGMLFSSNTPSLHLRRYIQDFWLCEGYTAPHRRERILPSGTFELVFNLKEDELRIYDRLPLDGCQRYSGAVASGPYCGYFGSDTAEEAAVMGVHFRPGGALPFLGIPAGELADSHIDLRDIWSRAASELRERLCAAATASERFGILERELIERLRHPPEGHSAVPVALEVLGQPGELSRSRELARYVGLSERRLTDIFRAQVGMTPKSFSRVQRFQRTLTHVFTRATVDWSDLAATCGYYDQSHMIRDFRAFSGLTPEELLHRKNAALAAGTRLKRNHLALA
jgi:AraC-like DNA-binding protein